MKTLLLISVLLFAACGKQNSADVLSSEDTCQATSVQFAQGIELWANDKGVFVQEGCTTSASTNSCGQVYDGQFTCGSYTFTVTNGVAN